MVLISRVIGFVAGYLLLVILWAAGLPLDEHHMLALYLALLICWNAGFLTSEYVHQLLDKFEIKKIIRE